MKQQLCLLVLSVSAVFAAVIPKDDVVSRCMDVSRDKLEPCLIKLVNEMRSDFVTGLPEFGLPPMTEVDLDNVTVSDYQNENSYINMAMWDIVIRGFEDMELRKLTLDYDNGIAPWELFFPELYMKAKYKIDARISLISLQGEGTMWARLKKVNAKGQCKFGLTDDNSHIKLEGLVKDVVTSDIVIRLNNLYKDNAILREAAEAFINNSSQELFDLIGYGFKKNLGDRITKVANKITPTLPLPDVAGHEYLTKTFRP